MELCVRTEWLASLERVAKKQQLAVDFSSLETSGKMGVWEWAQGGGLSEDLILESTASTLELPFFELVNEFQSNRVFLDRTPNSFARQHSLLGLTASDGTDCFVMGRVESWHQRS